MIKIPVMVTSNLNPLPAYAMAKSVRRHMEAELIHVAEPGAVKLEGFDRIMRLTHHDDLVRQFLRSMSMLDGNVLALDYDIIVQSDVSDVFDMDFDVAFTKRPEGDKTASKSLSVGYNMGVVFSKSTEFWRECMSIYDIQPGRDGWIRSQMIASFIADLLKVKYKVIQIPGEIFNYTPMTEDEDVSGRRIVHYKGTRKAWMLPLDQRHSVAADVERVKYLISKVNG